MSALGDIKRIAADTAESRRRQKEREARRKALARIYNIYYNEPLDEKLVYFESRDGGDFTGNILRICEELMKPAYGGLRFCVYTKPGVAEKIRALAPRYGLELSRMRFTEDETEAVCWMEKAKYLVVDSGIPWQYVKREGQIVVNTWHGTPLKVMGRYIPTENHRIGNVQHFFLSSDYILYPSYYMKDTMLRSYMVERAASGKVLMSGYPRNSVFLDGDRREKMRGELGYEGKTVYVYMPTHRGNSAQTKHASQAQDVIDYMAELDLSLRDDEIVLVKLHVYNQSRIDFVQFEHIRPFPEGYEPYDVLNAADVLITDYSSVMFDFANARRKTILFTYDEEEYFADRGLYFPLEELPFPNVKTLDDLLAEMRSPMAYDDTAFLEKFCTFDTPDAAEKLCRHVFLGEKRCREEQIGNGLENVLIFGGTLARNGITTALYNLLKGLDRTKRNYFLTFRRWDVDSDPARVERIPEYIDYLPLMNDQLYTPEEREAYDRFARSEDWDEPYPELLHRLFRREWDRFFWGVDFKYVIQFDGYGKNVNMLFMEHSTARRVIFVHNDMLREINEKHNQHGATMRTMYRNFDHVAIVSEEIRSMTEKVSGRKDNIVLVNNIHNYEEILENAEKPIEFQPNTLMRAWVPGGVEAFLSGDGFKFVTVGRFSEEKGHARLISAFEKFCENYPDAKLMIIGGYGRLYNDTVNAALATSCWRNIFFIRNIENPMPIVKQCDLFVMSSYYEGLPMTIKEADTLGVPVVSTDIPGPRYFMKRYGGYLVENSEEGVLQGMLDFAAGKVHAMNIDYEAYNRQARKEFDQLFEVSADE